MYKKFEFNLSLNKAYKDDEGKMHVIGVASDTSVDQQGDRMSERALRAMVRQARDNKLPLLETHRSTFAFGKTSDANLVDNGTTKQFVVDFELFEDFPQAKSLFREVLKGEKDKQLSIGGRLNLNNPKAIRFEDTKAGTVRIIEDLELDHIATTRRNHAANENTEFLSAIIKALDDNDEKNILVKGDKDMAEKKNATEEKDQELGLSFLGDLGAMLRRIVGVPEKKEDKKKKEEEENAEEVSTEEVAAKQLKELKEEIETFKKAGNKMSAKRLDALREAVTLLSSILDDVSAEPKKEKEEEKAEKKTEEKTEKKVEEKKEEKKDDETSLDKRLEKVVAKLEEDTMLKADEIISEIDKDLKAQDEKIDAVHKASEAVKKEYTDAIESLKEIIKALTDRLTTVEKVSGSSQSIEDNGVEEKGKNTGVFSGVFSRSVGPTKTSIKE